VCVRTFVLDWIGYKKQVLPILLSQIAVVPLFRCSLMFVCSFLDEIRDPWTNQN
jgi:hypothetical protein